MPWRRFLLFLTCALICASHISGKEEEKPFVIPPPEALYSKFKPNSLNFGAMKEGRIKEALLSFQAFAQPIPEKALNAWLDLEIPIEFGEQKTLRRWVLDGLLMLDHASDFDEGALKDLEQLRKSSPLVFWAVHLLEPGFYNSGNFFHRQEPPLFQSRLSSLALNRNWAKDSLRAASAFLELNGQYPHALGRYFREVPKNDALLDYWGGNRASLLKQAQRDPRANLALRRMDAIPGMQAVRHYRRPKNYIPGGLVVGGVVGGTPRFHDLDWRQPLSTERPDSLYLPTLREPGDFRLVLRWDIGSDGHTQTIQIHSMDSKLERQDRASLYSVEFSLKNWATKCRFVPASINGIPQAFPLFYSIKLYQERGGGDVLYSARLAEIRLIKPPSFEFLWMPPTDNPWEFLKASDAP